MDSKFRINQHQYICPNE